MPKLFRIATPKDYKFSEKLQCYELTFDTRPIQGTRCDDPEAGAMLYNNSRKKFVTAWEKSLPEGNDFNYMNFIDWAISNHDKELVKYAILMLSANDIDSYRKVVLHFLNSPSCTTRKFDLMLYFFGFEQRIKVPIEKRVELERLNNG